VSADDNRRCAPEPRASGPYAHAVAAINGFSERQLPSVSPAPGDSVCTDHAERDRRDEDLRRAVSATQTGRARKVVASNTARTLSTARRRVEL
jgi:hypothetical protein